MNARASFAAASLGLLLSLSNIGCGQVYRSSGLDAATSLSGGQSTSGATEVKSALEKARAASTRAQGALTEAQAAISSVSDASGNIALNLFSSLWSSVTGQTNAAPLTIDLSGAGLRVTSSGLLSPLVNKLTVVFNQVFLKVNEVKSNLDEARLLLATAAAQLDRTDPAQAVLIMQINRQMASLDLLENAFRGQMITLAGKVDFAKGQIGKLVTYGTSLIPVPGLNIIAGMLVDTFLLADVNNLLDAVKLKLLSV